MKFTELNRPAQTIMLLSKINESTLFLHLGGIYRRDSEFDTGLVYGIQSLTGIKDKLEDREVTIVEIEEIIYRII